MIQGYKMYKGRIGFIYEVGTHYTANIKDVDYMVSSGQISYYELIKENK